MQFNQLKRREFMSLLGGAAATWGQAARAQQSGRLPTIGILGSASAARFSVRSIITFAVPTSAWRMARHNRVSLDRGTQRAATMSSAATSP
jgi:hypothetical protein